MPEAKPMRKERPTPIPDKVRIIHPETGKLVLVRTADLKHYSALERAQEPDQEIKIVDHRDDNPLKALKNPSDEEQPIKERVSLPIFTLQELEPKTNVELIQMCEMYKVKIPPKTKSKEQYLKLLLPEGTEIPEPKPKEKSEPKVKIPPKQKKEDSKEDEL